MLNNNMLYAIDYRLFVQRAVIIEQLPKTLTRKDKKKKPKPKIKQKEKTKSKLRLGRSATCCWAPLQTCCCCSFFQASLGFKHLRLCWWNGEMRANVFGCFNAVQTQNFGLVLSWISRRAVDVWDAHGLATLYITTTTTPSTTIFFSCVVAHA